MKAGKLVAEMVKVYTDKGTGTVPLLRLITNRTQNANSVFVTDEKRNMQQHNILEQTLISKMLLLTQPQTKVRMRRLPLLHILVYESLGRRM